VKRLCAYILPLLVAVSLTAKADVPVFGNTTNVGEAFTISATASGESFGGAVAFTPLENISVTSVTLWLDGYTGEHDQAFCAGIYENEFNMPGLPVAALNIPPPNDGSRAAFTFTDAAEPATLEAGQEYWLFIYGAVPTNCPQSMSVAWVNGGAPTGDSVYDGSEAFSASTFGDSPDMPAFTINTVPEPGVMAFIGLAVLLGLGRVVCQRRISPQIAKRATELASSVSRMSLAAVSGK